MAFDYKKYNNQAIQAPFNDAISYGVTVEKAQAQEGELYFQAMGIHHLFSDENMGNHSIYLEVLDENNKRMFGSLIHWVWVGQRPEERPNPAKIDKPDSGPYASPGADIAMHGGQVISVNVMGSRSDIVRGLHAQHGPDGPNNYMGHHSFYVIFKKVRKGSSTPLPPEEPLPPTGFNKTFVVYEDAQMKITQTVIIK